MSYSPSVTSFPTMAAMVASAAAPQLVGSIVYLQGFYSAGDGGQGNFKVTNVAPNATDAGVNVASAISGYYYIRQFVGPVNLKWWGLYSDGTTDNRHFFDRDDPSNMKVFGKTLGATIPQTCTMTIASPCVVTLANHGLRVNEAVVFSTTGSLPTGVTAGVTYFVISAGLTADTFCISTKNAWILRNGEGSAINTTGSQSGTHSISIQGVQWQDIILPPGAYYSSGVNRFEGNQKRVRLFAYGAQMPYLSPQSNNGLGNNYNNADNFTLYGYVETFLLDHSQPSRVTLKTLADVTKFQIGGWVCIMALDLQSAYGVASSDPPNNHYCEYAQISAIDAGTGIITFATALKNSYRSTYPLFYAGNPAIHIEPGGGPAIIFPMCSDWDAEREIFGIYSTEPSQTYSSARRVKIKDCSYVGGYGIIPTAVKDFEAENCVWSGQIEIDKLIETITLTRCSIDALVTQSTSGDRLTLENCSISSILGTFKNMVIRNTTASQVFIGPGLYGMTESVLLENCRFNWVGASRRIDSPGFNLAYKNLVNRWTFSGGTIKYPIASTSGNCWAVPGQRMYLRDMAGNYQNMGKPFSVIDVYQSGPDFCVETTLNVDPSTLGGSTNSVVTISIANPAVVSWTTHGLTANTPITFMTTGTLPTGMNATSVYYVLAAGLTANSFRFSTSPGGAAVITSGSQSGTHTCVSNPLCFAPHPCAKITAINCTGSAQALDLSNSPVNSPLYTFSSRRLTGSNGTFLPSQAPKPTNWGKLVSMTVNVLQAYTGATSPVTLTITADGFEQTGITLVPFSQVIDLTVAGLRTITPTTATGSAGGDSISAYSAWLSGDISLTPISGAGTFAQQGIVEVSITTDQGTTKPMSMAYAGSTNTGGTSTMLIDSTTPYNN